MFLMHFEYNSVAQSISQNATNFPSKFISWSLSAKFSDPLNSSYLSLLNSNIGSFSKPSGKESSTVGSGKCLLFLELKHIGSNWG